MTADPTSGFAGCKCPECNHAINENEAQRLVKRMTGTVLRRQIRAAKNRNNRSFLWCPSSGCGNGEVYAPTLNPFVTCKKCKARICFSHQVMWHEGLTCHQYDLKAAANLDPNAKKDMLEIKRTTKPCPFCKLRIRKEGGCNHMECGGCKKKWLCKVFTSFNRDSR